MSGEAVRIKRFYAAVSVGETDDGYAILLDGKRARTPSCKALAAPSERLAQAVAAEWEAQGDFIDRNMMPLTGMLSAAIDAGVSGAQEWREDILNYLGSDLVCYRAEEPAALAERQRAVWDPYLDWLRNAFGAALATTSGVIAVDQPDAAAAAVRRALDKEPAEILFSLKIATAISGSAVLALALWKKAFEPIAIFEASRVDERFQEERWGVDEEAKTREERLRLEFLKAGEFLSLL